MLLHLPGSECAGPTGQIPENDGLPFLGGERSKHLPAEIPVPLRGRNKHLNIGRKRIGDLKLKLGCRGHGKWAGVGRNSPAQPCRNALHDGLRQEDTIQLYPPARMPVVEVNQSGLAELMVVLPTPYRTVTRHAGTRLNGYSCRSSGHPDRHCPNMPANSKPSPGWRGLGVGKSAGLYFRQLSLEQSAKT